MSQADPQHILVVDDEPEICNLVTRYLEREGYQAAAAGDGAAMRRQMAQQRFDLVVLDVHLPGDDGFTLARELRQGGDVGILMLTSRDDVIDRVAGLESGADDYMPKPFHPRELLARVRSILRRRQAGDATAQEAAPNRLSFGGWQLDLDSHQLRNAAGQPVALSPTEFALLRALLEHPKRVLSRDYLLDRISGRDAGPYDRAVDVHVSNLRKKLEPDPKRPVLIETVRGAGYRLSVEVARG